MIGLKRMILIDKTHCGLAERKRVKRVSHRVTA